MPHSSGGGSFNGGFHSGSSSPSSGSGYYSRPSHKIRKDYFDDSRLFACYRNGKTKYMYSNFDVSEKAARSKENIKAISLFAAVMFLVIIATVFWGNIPPQKITANYNTQIVIDDQINELGDTTALYDALRAFQSETGITPVIVTVHNEDWNSEYRNLERFAYDLYVRNIPDEYHWLIVYSEPTNPDTENKNWYWEGMQGNYTDNVLTESVASAFGKKLQANLLNADYSVSDAIEKAFAETTPTIMQWSLFSDRISFLRLCLILILVGLAMLWIRYAVLTYKEKHTTYMELAPVPREKIEEEQCEHCGKFYAKGQHLTCPHCGIVIKTKRK